MERIRVDGVDYSPEGIEAIREVLIEQRKAAMDAWPEGIQATVLLSHLIALLADYKELREGEEKMWYCPQCRQFVEPLKISSIVDGLVLVECPKCYHQKEIQVDEIPKAGDHTAEWNRGDVRIKATWSDDDGSTSAV